MKDNKENKDGINEYLEDREYMANTYVMRCFGIFMFLYFIVFLLNWFEIFISVSDYKEDVVVRP